MSLVPSRYVAVQKIIKIWFHTVNDSHQTLFPIQFYQNPGIEEPMRTESLYSFDSKHVAHNDRLFES